jgi:hypothetical protein
MNLLPSVLEVAGLAADEEAIWVVSRTPNGEPGCWYSRPITRELGRWGTLDQLLQDAGLPFGCHPWVHGTSEREDATLVPPGLDQPGALVLTNAAVIGGHGRLGDLAGTPMASVPERFPLTAFALAPDLIADVGRAALPPGPHAPPRVRRLDPVLHAVRHLSFLLGIRHPDGSWAVEPDPWADVRLDRWWRYHLGPMRKALAGWWADGGDERGWEGPAPGQRQAPLRPAVGMVCPTCLRPAGAA